MNTDLQEVVAVLRVAVNDTDRGNSSCILPLDVGIQRKTEVLRIFGFYKLSRHCDS